MPLALALRSGARGCAPLAHAAVTGAPVHRLWWNTHSQAGLFAARCCLVRPASTYGDAVCGDTVGSNLATGPSYTKQQLTDVHTTHIPPEFWVDSAALYTVKAMRFGFDTVSLYNYKKSFGLLNENDWTRRICFLETVAGVPGIVAGGIRHLHSLRLMRRDYGWIHTLLAEAENERMHLLIAMKLREPSIMFRFCVALAQFAFLPTYFLAYLASPRFCHRFVAYLEEEAVFTYSTLLAQMDAGKLPVFSQTPSPKFAAQYYNLPEGSMLRDVFECIRADESSHRDTNHNFGNMKATDPNYMTDHLKKHQFSSYYVTMGKQAAAFKFKEDALRTTFAGLDTDKNGELSLQEMIDGSARAGLTEDCVQQIFKQIDKDNSGTVDIDEFVNGFIALEGFDGKMQ